MQLLLQPAAAGTNPAELSNSHGMHIPLTELFTHATSCQHGRTLSTRASESTQRLVDTHGEVTMASVGALK